MVIQLQNQYMIQVSIGDKSDFILQEDFRDFVYIESACQMLPTISLKFVLRDMSIFKLINEGNPLVIGVGRTALELIEMRFKLALDQNANQASVGQEVSLRGVLYAPEFTIEEKTRTFSNKTSLEVMKEVASRYFKFVTNIGKTVDRQSWRQGSVSDWSFLKEVALHSFIDTNTFINFSFDSSNCYFYDIRECFKNPNTIWQFSKSAVSGENSKVINFNSSRMVNNYGLHNLIAGYKFEDTLYGLGSYESSNLSPKLKSFSAVDTTYLNILKEHTTVRNFMYKSRNTHENYDLAKLQNLRNLIVSSSVKTLVTFGGQFKKLKLLDVCQFDQASSEIRNSGYQLVSRIVYQVTENRLMTNVVLVREAPNSIRGDLVKVEG